MPNVKYLAFGTSNIKKHFSWGILNRINFDTREQYCSVFGTVQTDVLKNKNLLFYSFPLSAFITFLSSLFYFFLLSSSFCSYLLSLPLPFFFFFLLQHLHHMASSGVFFFFFIYLFFFIFFLSLSLSLSLSRLQPSPIRFQFNSNCLRRRGRWGFKAQLADWSLLIFAHPLAVADLKLCLPSGSRRSLLVILHSSCRRSRCQCLVEFGHWLICWVRVLLKILRFIYLFIFFFIFFF